MKCPRPIQAILFVVVVLAIAATIVSASVTTQESVVKDWLESMDRLGSCTVGLGGLIVAAIALFLSYKERTSFHREILYSKQLELYGEVVDTIAGVTLRVAGGIPESSFDVYSDLIIKMSEWRVYLPDEVMDSLVYFERYFRNGLEDLEHGPDISQLAAQISAVVRAIRRNLGVGPLSEETLKLFGMPPKGQFPDTPDAK